MEHLVLFPPDTSVSLCSSLCPSWFCPCGPFSFHAPRGTLFGMTELGFGHIAFRSLWPGRAGSDRGSEFRREDVRKPAMDLGRPPKECKRPNGQCDPSTNFFFFGLGTATHSRTSWLNLGAGLADCGGCTLPTTGKLTIILPDHAERGRGRFLRRRRRLLDEERLEPCTGP